MKLDPAQHVEQLLNNLGLEHRRGAVDYLLPALGVFAAGALVGGLLGLLFAPQSGRELRSAVQKRFEVARDGVNDNGLST